MPFCVCLAGLLVRLCFRKWKFYSFTAFDLPESRDTDPNLLLRVQKNMWRNVKATTPYFLLGVALTALYQRYVPSEVVAGLFGANQGFGTLMAAALGVPLYTCGGGTIPLLSAWLGEAMELGQRYSLHDCWPCHQTYEPGRGENRLGRAELSVLHSVFHTAGCGLGAGGGFDSLRRVSKTVETGAPFWTDQGMPGNYAHVFANAVKNAAHVTTFLQLTNTTSHLCAGYEPASGCGWGGVSE